MTVVIQIHEQKIRAQAVSYSWELDRAGDVFSIFDSSQRCICRASHQPLVLSARQTRLGQLKSVDAAESSLRVAYAGVNGEAVMVVSWRFEDEFIQLGPLEYHTPLDEDILRVAYFARTASPADEWLPTLYSRYVVAPGLCMSTCVSPVVDLHAKLSTSVALGSGAMRGPGLTQQWGLPAHYFALFNTSDRWNAIGARDKQSGAACWGLAELPQGDFRLEMRENAISPVLNLRSDLWKHLLTPGTLRLGCSFVVTFGENFHEAIRNYYKTLLAQKVIRPKGATETPHKREVLLAPQYNTWGVESALAINPEQLTGAMVDDIFRRMRRSGMQARAFVVDDKWEGRYGELRHDEARFPAFEKQLDSFRAEGFFIGLWAAFLRCQDPAALGLDESHLLCKPNGQPLWLAHQTARYGIFDVTQPRVQDVLRQRAREFIRRYRPDLVKFDFGYELPCLDVAAPLDKAWSGEKLLQKGLDVVVGAMKEENPDLVIMYYGLSPLLLDYYDLHSPDDLVYCGGDYDLETNRRIFFSSLCGELGMPTYGSSGYDWVSAPEIWFDSVAAGTLGSLHCFDGDENGDMPTAQLIARFNGLAALVRQRSDFHLQPLDAAWQGGLRAAFSPSWERFEDGNSVLIALRTHNFDGKPARHAYKHILHTDVGLVLASLTGEDLAVTRRLGLVPFGSGRCCLACSQDANQARITEHFFGGKIRETLAPCAGGRLELTLLQSREGEPLEWLEVSLF
jgi:hypothetical protein